MPLSLFWGPLCTLTVVSGPWGEAFCCSVWLCGWTALRTPLSQAPWHTPETWGDRAQLRTSHHGVNEDYPFQTELTTEPGPHRPTLAPAATPRTGSW